MPPMRSHTGMTTPRFDLSRNPPYQINFRAKRAGKTISASKRRITFQFGFSSASAISSGMTAVDCRGEEHEVVLIWSHMTGKRQLFMDGREVHTSKVGMGNTQFVHSWVIPGNHLVKIIAHGTPPLGGDDTNFRQFDLELDGMSYFSFKKIYELGGKATGGRREAAPRASTTYNKRPEALMFSYVGLAIDDDDEDAYDEDPLSMRSAPARSASAPVDLFDSQPPTPIASPASHFGMMHHRFAPPTQVQVPTSSMSQYNSVPSLAVSSSSYSMSSQYAAYDEFAPIAVPKNPPQKSFDVISNQILGAYGNENVHSSPSNQISSQSQVESVDAVTKSMQSLVNLDDITATSPTYSNKTSTPMNQQSNSWGFAARAPTLSEINSAVRPPVMNTHHAVTMEQGYQQQQTVHHPGQPQALAANYGYYHNQQPQQFYAPAY